MALDIAGSEAELMKLRDKKTVQNWKSAPAHKEIVPVSALAPILYAWWSDKWKPIVERRIAEERARYRAETLDAWKRAKPG